MTRTASPTAPARRRRSAPPTRTPSRASRALAATSAVAATLALVATTGGAAAANGWGRPSPADDPVVTRAALDPSLVEGRGADVAFVEQEAENVATNGTVITSREAYDLAAEASGRSAVQLERGQHIDFTLPEAANAITVRYSIPDAPGGGGITSELKVKVDRGHTKTMDLTSEYSWLYNQYQFSNDPEAQLLHPDWWVVECDGGDADTGCDPATREVTTPFRPMHFYDEQRLHLGRTYAAGSTVRLEVPKNAKADVTTIDLLDSEKVAKPHVEWKAANVLLFGADPRGKKDSAPALDKAIAWAKKKGLPVYVPPGEYRVDRHIIVDDVTIIGAGNWWTTFKGSEVALDEPSDDGSVHTGVGFYGKWAEDGGSSDVHLSGFAIQGDVRERIDTDQVNGIGGAFDDSSFTDLYIQHTKVGLWLDGPMDNVTIKDNIVVDQIADGMNFHLGVTNSEASNNFFRNTGDDAMAMWSEAGDDNPANANNTFSHNTVQTPTLANGIAIYGGENTTVANNLVADPIREGSGLHAGARFGATPFEGTLDFTDNSVVRAGTFELNWRIGLGAIWFYALDQSIDADISVTGDHYLDSTYNAMMLVSEWTVKDEVRIDGVKFKDVRVDGAGTSAVSARVAGGASFENVDVRNLGWAGVNNCGSFNFPNGGTEFVLTDLGGNDGTSLSPWEPDPVNWLGRFVPNAPSCNDRPTVVAPPAPSEWEQPVG
ncbi:mycodextranase [Paraoerskovia sediminicola]|uniref:Mycodextranase n=1 Tax=Paraoerskovia sediminicola TaxID=1138587 RepID=A0ABM8G1H0_9CELL|nr:glycosyl hydrolase family 28-related protein [Paraoerskovia sediminicola]BDZ41852.1 mycodextranase [Paraoerskovia sediminicola]